MLAKHWFDRWVDSVALGLGKAALLALAYAAVVGMVALGMVIARRFRRG